MWWKSEVNFSFFLSLATRRMRSSAFDALSRSCARRAFCWPAFPLVPALGSPGSVPGRPALFVGFTATTAGADFPCSCLIGYGSSPSRCGPAQHRCWSNAGSPRFRCDPFVRDVAIDPGRASAPRITVPHMLPSTEPTVSAPTMLCLSWLIPTPHMTAMYASRPPSPTAAQHSLPGGPLRPYLGRTFTGWIAPAWPGALGHTFTPDRSDQPFGNAILPGRGWCNWPIPDAHGAQSAGDDCTVDAVPVADHVARSFIPRECFCDLARNPFRGRMRCDADPGQLSAIQPHYDVGVEQVEANGGDNEQVHGGNVWRVVMQEGSPSLAWRTASLDHVFGDTRLRDLKPELEQLTVNAWRTPKRILHAH